MSISPVQAHILSGFFAVSCFGSIYVLPRARLSLGTANARHRDDPGVIRARLLAITCSTIMSCVVVGIIVKRSVPEMSNGQALAQTADLLGLYPFHAPILSYLVVPVLYLGPLYALFLERTLPGQPGWSFAGSVRPAYGSWIAIRNYWIAPFMEEVIFRACVLAVHMLAISDSDRSANVRLVWLTPLSFGVAHVHHAWENWHRMGKTSGAAKQAMLIALFQLAYTTLFGAHCAFVFLRGGSVWPTVTAHMWCNFMGIPQIADEVRRFANRKKSIYMMYLLGVVGYIFGMRNWTLAPGTKWERLHT